MELFLIKHILDQSIEEKKLYCFYANLGSNFFCGYVLSYNTDTVMIRHYDKYGQSDGTISLSYSDIRQISIKGAYIDKMEFLIENQQRFDEIGDIPSYHLAPTSEGFTSILQKFQNDRNSILNIDTSGELYPGFVEDIIVTSHYIFTEIDDEGRLYETSVQKTEDISSVRVNDRISRRNLLLYLWRKENDKIKNIQQ